MKVVALVSGGKDSTFNMLHCVLNGHEVVAMANLRPPSTAESDEMDSFMYQTVGHSALDSYSECMGGIPMYRGEIKGTSKVQTLEYKSVGEEDETEDLLRLLQRVQKDYPDLGGVSVGAILSTYQRTRVEDVCGRLGLTSLAYLWERSQAELLDEIIAGNVDARIIKTAAYGLGRNHLGKGLGEIRNELVKMNGLFGLHLCGEGGEYETMVFDMPLFVKRLVANSQKVVGSSHDDVWHLTLDQFTTEVKTEGDFGFENLEKWKHLIRIPPLLEEGFNSILQDMNLQSLGLSDEPEYIPFDYTASQATTPLAVYNLTAPASFNSGSIEDEATALFERVTEFMKSENIQSTNQFTFSSLVLSSMANFQSINKVYSSYFREPIPPARVCIESRSIVNDMRIQLSLTFVRQGTPTTSPKTGLHVQGRSYWAPANIGPYSQATCSDGTVYLAGQIPLNPASMELLQPLSDVTKPSALSLQHISRVMRSVVPATASKPEEMFAYISAIVSNKAAGSAALNIWDEYLSSIGVINGPPMFVVQVSGLPRGAPVEWAGLGIDHAPLAAYDEDDSDNEDEPTFYKSVTYKSVSPTVNATLFGTQILVVYSLRSGSANPFTSQQDFTAALQEVGIQNRRYLSGTLYVTSAGSEAAKQWANAFDNRVEIVLVDAITSHEGSSLDLAFVTREQAS